MLEGFEYTSEKCQCRSVASRACQSLWFLSRSRIWLTIR